MFVENTTFVLNIFLMLCCKEARIETSMIYYRIRFQLYVVGVPDKLAPKWQLQLVPENQSAYGCDAHKEYQ